MFSLFKPKIELFVRHCHFSEVSQHKNRFKKFSRERCHRNLMETLDPREVNVTFLLDTFYPTEKPHFILREDEKRVVKIKEGNEAASFLRLLEYVTARSFKDDTIIYFLEDDYLHRPGWVEVLKEGFTVPDTSYVTLFDHKDKYDSPSYQNLESKLYYTTTCHWRVTPSTTNTYAMRFKTLKDHLEIHKSYSQGRRISSDHDKFVHLAREGARLISSLPGYSTHVEPEYASPCFDWEQLLKE